MIRLNDLLKDTLQKGKIPAFLLLLFFTFLPLTAPVSNVAFVLLVIYFFYSGSLGKSLDTIKKDRGLQSWIAFYLLHVIGMSYSSNLVYGFTDLQTKISILIFPFLLSAFRVSESEFNKIKKYFVLSCSVSLLILIAVSCFQYFSSGDAGYFFYTKLSHGYHPNYISMYLSFSILIVLDTLFSKKDAYPQQTLLFFFLFLFSGVLLLSGRTSIGITIFFLVFFPVVIAGKKLVKKKLWLMHVIVIFTSAMMLFGYLHLFNRFQQVEEAITIRENSQNALTIPQEEPNSTNIRINLWKNAFELIEQHPLFGIGTGDIKEELLNMYQKNEYAYGIKEKPSPHNQFLHTGVILGLTGISVLVLCFFFPLYYSFKNKYWLYFFFLLMVVMNCMTESILERQAGIIFFAGFNMCFYFRLRYPGSAKKTSSDNN